MGIIWTILIGFIVGIVAKFLMPGRDPAGFIITVLIGIVGSVVATYLGRALGFYQVGESAGFIAAVLGAIILLFIYRMVTGRKA
ncbi:MAG TPA: GlsB/YeaQ/YmgE family stress response membrane protein [Polaromonas sp.]|uniref:GlsB/YeaQ/YmgE family stress response membrane protein n=1 Tax=Polaromonas sp. TaxID=1869339 RepID=UPI002D5F9AF9|nr:GlsB/YeaQ/YmgE family stress response membrane protein [Polaromonas sp.]HYW55884.1 GlsB/YeaQ/YmgE family stress response membrane protein [Polaromonas sp.]